MVYSLRCMKEKYLKKYGILMRSIQNSSIFAVSINLYSFNLSKTMRKHLLIFVLLLTPVTAFSEETSFANWLNSFANVAKEQGITEATWQKAFAGITEPDPVVLEKAAWQPEFKSKIWDYLDTRVNILKATEGQQQWRLHADTLTEVSHRFGVEPEILLAIWSMESNFGAALQQRSRLHYVPQALATLAWKDKRRQKFARSQLIAALKILQAGDINRQQLTGSWAGAMGHTQFIPTSYLAYGVDMDGNGRRDIWASVPDALATAANLLKKNGWRTGKKWGYEVIFPEKTAKYLALEEETKTLSEWQRLGFRRPNGKPFPHLDQNAILKLPAQKNGPAFLAMKNFYILKRYNNADAYALAVGLLADQISGKKGLVSRWPRPIDSLDFNEKMELQRLLQQKGYYSSAIDGALGPASREAINKWQMATGRVGDNTTNREILDLLRKNP